MSISSTDYLSGAVPLISESFRFELLDASGMPLHAELAVDRTQGARITNDSTRDIMRTITGVRVLPRKWRQDTDLLFAEDIDVTSMRVAAYQDFPGADPLPLGVFVWGDDAQARYSWGAFRSCAFVDLGEQLTEPFLTSTGFATGTNISSALEQLAALAGVSSYEIESTTVVLANPVGWAAGRDRYLDAMRGLCQLAGFLPPYYSNTGVLTIRGAPTLPTATPDFIYGGAAGDPIYEGSIVYAGSVLKAPNRYVAVNTGSTGEPIVGVFDIPDEAPNSYANTQRYRTKVLELQGGENDASMEDAARAAYANDPDLYTTLTYATAPDGRYDTFDVVQYEDEEHAAANYQSSSWDMPLVEGGAMTHAAKGITT